MRQQKVSVLICTRNRSDSVKHAIHSIIVNSYPDFELVIVDQSDNDKTQEIVNGYLQAYSKISYFKISSLGAGKAKSFGLKKCRGEIIAFTDDDCIVDREWIEKIVLLFERNPNIGIIFGSVLAPSGYNIKDGFTPLYQAKDVLFKGPCSKIRARGISANMAIKRDLFEKIGGFDEMLGPGAALPGNVDYDYSYRALRKGFQIFESSSVKVVHFDIRKWGKEAMDKFRQYEISRLAVYLKYMRCGDWIAFQIMLMEIFIKIFQLFKFSLFGPKVFKIARPIFFLYMSSKYCSWWLLGIVKSFSLAVDNKRYVFCAASNNYLEVKS